MPRPLRAFLAALALLAAGCGSRLRRDAENAKPLKVAHASGESKVPGRRGAPAGPERRSARRDPRPGRAAGGGPSSRAGAPRPICAVPGSGSNRRSCRAHPPRGGPRPRRDPRQQSHAGPPLRTPERDRPHRVQRGRRRGQLEARPAPVRRGARPDEPGRGTPQGLGSHGRRGAAQAAPARPARAWRSFASSRGRRVLARPEAFPGKVLSDAGLVPAEERQGADVVLVSRAPGATATPASLGAAQGDSGGRPPLVGRRRPPGRAGGHQGAGAGPSRPDGRVAPPRPRAWCSWRRRSPRGPARPARPAPAKFTVLLWRVRPRSRDGSVRDGPSTSTSMVRPTKRCARSVAWRWTASTRRSIRSRLTSGGSWSGSVAAVVPRRGEKMNVKAESKRTSSTTSIVSSKSASVSPGKPDDDVRAERAVRHALADHRHPVEVALAAVGAAHGLQDAARARLEREVDVLAHARQLGVRARSRPRGCPWDAGSCSGSARSPRSRRPPRAARRRWSSRRCGRSRP